MVTQRKTTRRKQSPAPHGTLARFVDGCLCDLCKEASNSYRRHVYRQKAYGRWNPWESGDAVREHIANLRAVGMSLATIGALADVGAATVAAIVYGSDGYPPTEKVTAERARRIYAVRLDLDLIDPRAKIATAGTMRRLQALIAIGWSQQQLTKLTGLSARTIGDIVYARFPKVTVASAVAVRDVYDRLWLTPPPERTKHEKIAAGRARSLAAANDWVRGAMWDDDEIDDPRAVPADTTPRRRDRAQFPRDEELLWLVRMGETNEAIAQRFAVEVGTVKDAIRAAEKAEREAAAIERKAVAA
jgi:lambda repressor-like predicted transcriptional regulator